jgi:hypothetical protein
MQSRGEERTRLGETRILMLKAGMQILHAQRDIERHLENLGLRGNPSFTVPVNVHRQRRAQSYNAELHRQRQKYGVLIT